MPLLKVGVRRMKYYPLRLVRIGLKVCLKFGMQFFNYFFRYFFKKNKDKHRLDDVTFQYLMYEDNLGMTNPFLSHELDKVMAHCHGNKIPGLDGFNFSFLRNLWHLLREDLRIMFDQFYFFSFLTYLIVLHLIL